jgi:hypothetical protein
MAIRRGFAKVKEAKENNSGGNRSTLTFKLGDGESAHVRFYGDFENQMDPIVGVQHYVHRLPKGRQYHQCSDNLPDGDVSPCVFCYAQNQGDKGIKKQNRAYFWLKDFRKVHKLDQEVRVLRPGVVRVPGKSYSDSDYTTTKYPPCVAPKAPCQYCKQGNKSEVNGYRVWELAVQYAEQLVSQQAAIRDYCKCGARSEENGGTIQITRYLCGNPECGEEVDFDPNRGHPVAKCVSCRQTHPPLEEIVCTACESPERCDLTDFVFKVTRSGGGTDTTYNFEAAQQKSPTKEDLEEAAKTRPDFDKMLRPEAPEMQASVLGIPNPYPTAGHGAGRYDEPEEEVEEAPAPKKLGGGSSTFKFKKLAKPAQKTADEEEYY